MKVASMDLGSNSFLLLIAEVVNGKFVKVLLDEQKVTRLAQGVHENREFHQDALARAEMCFQYYKELIDEYQVDKIQAVSTSAARDVRNKDQFIQLGQKYNIPIEIISGSKEAELTFEGTLTTENSEISIIDVGGGSTEIIGKNNDKITGWSLDIGSVRLAEMFDAFSVIDKKKLLMLDKYIFDQLDLYKDKLPKIDNAIAVAGTPTTLSCLIQKIEFSPERVENFELTYDSIALARDHLASLTLEQRKNLTGIHPKRADVLVCGTSILKNICEYFNLSQLTVSCRGVRYGLAKSMSIES